MDKIIIGSLIVVFVGIPMMIIIKFFIDLTRLLWGWLDIDDFNSVWSGMGPDCTTRRLVAALKKEV